MTIGCPEVEGDRSQHWW